jgi:16S rRNA processing protein RimM
MEELIAVGKLGKAHGLKGELKLSPAPGFEEDVEQAKCFLVKLSNQMLPLFVEHIRGGGFQILKIEGFDSRESAKSLENKEVYLKKDQLLYDLEVYQAEEGAYFAYLQGFEMLTVEEVSLGCIVRVEEYPQQDMAILERENREIMIPLVPQFIHKISKPMKKIWVNLPEGLLSL